MKREEAIRSENLTNYFLNKIISDKFTHCEVLTSGVAILAIIIASLKVTEEEEIELMKEAGISIKKHLEAARKNRTQS